MFSLTVLVCYRSRFAVNRETQIKAEVRKFVGKIDDIIRSNEAIVVYLKKKAQSLQHRYQRPGQRIATSFNIVEPFVVLYLEHSRNDGRRKYKHLSGHALVQQC